MDPIIAATGKPDSLYLITSRAGQKVSFWCQRSGFPFSIHRK